MTSQKDQIQSLIADIEQVLGTQRPKKPWVRASDMEPQRQTLARAQEYLRSLQESFKAPAGWGPVDPETGQLIAPDAAETATEGQPSGIFADQPMASRAKPGTTPEDVLQSLLTEMKFLRSSALEPLRLEMDSLRQERDGLQQEVKGLEAQRSAILATTGSAVAGGHSSISEEQLNEFLAVLMERLQERLSVQVTQTLGQLEADHSDVIAKLTEATDAEVLQLRPAGQSIEEMRELQTRSDQLLVNIESTLQGMYETLQKNIDSYQISLNEGIENMHSLGRQGEVIVRSLVDHLTQQLGQTAPPEPAFFPTRSADSNITYALVDSPNTAALPTAESITAAIATAEEETATDGADPENNDEANDDNANDTVSSLNDILPEGTIAAEGFDNHETMSLVDEANEMDISAGENAIKEDAQSIINGTEADHTARAIAEESSDDASELNPENCIREDGTIDLDLLKLDIDRADDAEELTAEDVMVDAAIADAQVAAAEVEDPDIEAKVTPTPDAAYLAELTLDDLTSVAVDDFGDDTSITAAVDAADDATSAESLTADSDLADILPDLGDPLPDVSRSESLFPTYGDESTDTSDPETSGINDSDSDQLSESHNDVAQDATLFEVPFASEELMTETDAAADAEPSADPKPSNAAAMAAAALGAAAAVGATRSEPSESSSDLDFWDSAVVDETPESAQVPDIPDAKDEKPVDADADSESLDIDDTVSPELASELEADSLRADQIAASAVRSGLEAVSTLTPDLEEPIVSEADMPEPARLSEDTEPMESSKIPDWPEDEENVGGEEPAATTLIQEETAASEDITEDEEEIDAESTLSLPAMPVIAAPLPSENPPQFLDDDPFEIEAPLTDETVTETNLPETGILEVNIGEANIETDSSNPEIAAAPDAFNDDLDFLEPSSVADKAADDLIEKLSTESFEEEDLLEGETALVDPLAELQSTELQDADLPSNEEALTGFPELPVIVPPDSDTPLPAASGAATNDDDSVADEVIPEEYARYDDESDDGEDDPTDGQPASWFLGIDLGTTGLSAVLINRLGEQVYPLYWQGENSDGEQSSRTTNDAPEESQYGLFRLPVVIQVDENERTTDAGTSPVGGIGLTALQSEKQLRIIKPLLKVGIPQGVHTPGTPEATEGPLIQWSDHQALLLHAIQAALTQLLSTLSPQNLNCKAINLKRSALRRILGELEGVAVGYPNNWPDTYSFNIREAVLAAGIVSQPAQIFFVEEAIAALLSALPDPQSESDPEENRQPSLYNCNWQGGTVVISAGATLTEAGVVDLPTELDQLIYRDFALRSFTYAGDSLDQDIICQLLHAPVKQAATDTDTDVSGWDSLGLDRLQLPQAGEADRIKRHRLRQRLNDSQLGREVIAAARELKMVLQEETQCELTLAGQSWVVKRKDLETKVFIPYIQRVNRQINSLLNQKGLAAQAVKQVICTGGSAALGAIARWLRQKFPNATIIQDTYSGEYSNSCSRVAYGLANLCNYPHVLDTHRHQYNDYFLLLELLRVLPDQPLPAGGILHLLEQRGVNIQACQSHILALIEGHLPPGLVPTEGDRPLISAQSPNIETYRALSELPLFRKQGGQIYIADEQQGERLRQHLEALLATKHQTLSEPLSANLITETA
ncbi:MAG: hypothetical protein AB8B99_06110 [Phormidesmis sp.]